VNIVLTVLPIFLLVAIGYALRAVQVVKQGWIRALNGFVYWVSLPSLVIYSFMRTDWQGSKLVGAALWNGVFLVANAVVAAGISFLVTRHRKDRALVFIGCQIMNSVYLGIPLMSRVTGADAEGVQLIVFIAVIQLVGSMMLALVGTELLFQPTKNMKGIAKKLAFNPLILASLAGIFVSLLHGTSYPEAVSGPLQMLASTASPLALFVLGAFLYGKSLRHKKTLIIAMSTAKLVISPFLAWLLLYFIVRGSGLSNTVTVLSAGMPIAVTAFVLSEAYELDSGTIAAAMLLSTMMSVGSISLLGSLV
jgi:predicted permease